MGWEPEIEELNRRRRFVEQMGGEESVAKHHARGKLTVRERIAALVDPGSFEELGALTGVATYDEAGQLTDLRPANSVVGKCKVDGRRMVVTGGDYTVRGGAGDANIANKGAYAEGIAMDWRVPLIRLLDATGGSVRTFELIGRTYLPGRGVPGPTAPNQGQMLNTIPVVSTVLGSVAGLPAVQACFAHFNVMVRRTSQIFVGGPPVVKASLGYDISKEDLGSEEIQAYESGVIDNVADSEEEAFAIVKHFLSFMANNVWEMAPRTTPTDDPNRRDEELLSVIPRKKNRAYDPYEILNRILDHDTFFEISPFYGRSRIMGLARVNGYPVGAMINNPMHLGGAIDVAGAEKLIRFVQLLDTFHLPMVYFADEPGLMVGLESEKKGMVRVGARASYVINQTKMPWIAFIIRQLFGVGGGLHMRGGGMRERYAWPSASWGSMHIEGGTMAAYRREIEAAPDPEAKRAEIEARLQGIASPFRTAETFAIENIIDPRDSRPLLCDFVEAAQPVLKSQLGPSYAPLYRP